MRSDSEKKSSTSNAQTITAEDINAYSEMFDTLCAKRHERGQEKYGAVKFLDPETDLFEELRMELVDAANYARYHFIRLCLLQDLIAAGLVVTRPNDTPLGQMRDTL
jgi:hypothetical protein